MKKIIVRYKVKPDKVIENEQLVTAVYKQLQEKKLDGFHYATLKLEDGTTFIHIAFADSEQANKEFSNLPAFKNFQSDIKNRCDEQPIVTSVTVIGAYNLFKEDYC